MKIRTRKFLGLFLLTGFMAIYAVAVMTLAVDVIGATPKLVELLFYAIAGIAWILPARYIVAWMQRADD